MDETDERPRRRWFGRRRDGAGTGAQTGWDEPGPPRPEPDWNAVVADPDASLPPVDWADWSSPAGGQQEAGTRPDAEVHEPPGPSERAEPPDGPAENGWSEWAPPDPGPAQAPPATARTPEGPEPAEGDGAAEVTTAPAVQATDAGDQSTDESATAAGAAAAPESEAAGASAAPESAEAAGASETGVPAAPGPAEDLTVAVWETLSAPDGETRPPAATSPTDATTDATSAGVVGATATAAAPEGEEEPPRYRTTLSWPPPRKPRIGAGFLSMLVMVIMVALLVTNGQFGGEPDDSRRDVESLPALETDPAAVPDDWIVYRHPTAGFGISYPPGWTVRDDGTAVEIRDPVTRAALEIGHRRPPGGTDPEDHWLAEERDLSAGNTGYRRLQLSEASYQGHLAALWEYTFTEGNTAIHAADLEFVTEDDRFTLSFRGPVSEWQGLLETFKGFLNSFRVPE